MRVAINAETTLGSRTGDGTYTRNLVRAIAGVDRENEYRLYYGYLRPPRLPVPPGPNFRNLTSRLPGRLRKLMLEVCGVSIDRFVGPVEVVHEPSVFLQLPAPQRARWVVTVFEVLPLRFPEAYRHLVQGEWGARLQAATRRADCVITTSHSSEQDLQEFLRIPLERIRVISLAPDPLFHPVARDLACTLVRERYGLQGRVILSVGLFEPHKNLGRLLQAFHRARPSLDPDDTLVFAGPTVGRDYPGLVKQVSALGIEARVRFLGFVPSENLVALMNAAATVVIPSLWEGFGLPIVEAMACATPVITSNVGATREIAEDAAILINPTDTDMIAEAIVAVMSDRDLADSLSRKGSARAASFSWTETAKRTVQAYTELA